jgi:hypothetical protein
MDNDKHILIVSEKQLILRIENVLQLLLAAQSKAL